MRIFYIITCIILWILIILQIPSMIRTTKLLKRQMKSLEEIEDLHHQCENAYKELEEEKQKYRDAKERILATMLPDIEETSNDDTSSQEDGEPEFLYIHKNSTITIQAARCDLDWLATEIGYIVHRLYCGLHEKDPASAAIFRDFVTWSITGESSPTWNTGIANESEMIIVPGEAQEDDADEE